MVIGDLSWFELALFLGLTALGLTSPERFEFLGLAGFIALILGVQQIIGESMLVGGSLVILGLLMLFAVLRDRV